MNELLQFEDPSAFRFDPGWYSLATQIVLEIRKQREIPSSFVEKEGTLTKMGYHVANWKIRYFVLEGNRISYYKKKGQTKKPLGEIVLNPFSKCKAVREGLELREADAVASSPSMQNGVAVYPQMTKPNCLKIMIPGMRTYYAYASTSEIRDEWVQAIETNIDYIRSTEEGKKYLFDLAQLCVDKLGMDPDGTMISQLRLVLEGKSKPQIEAFQDENWYSMHLASSTGNLGDVQRLEKEGISLEVKNVTGGSPIHQAAAYNRTSVLQYLIEKQVDVNSLTNSGNTPLHLAARLGARPAVRVLLENGADTSLTNTNGASAHFVAAADDIRQLIEEFDGKRDEKAPKSSPGTAKPASPEVPSIESHTEDLRPSEDTTGNFEDGEGEIVDEIIEEGGKR